MASNDPLTGQTQSNDTSFAVDTPVRSGGGSTGSSTGSGSTGSTGSSGTPVSPQALKEQARQATGQAKQAATQAATHAYGQATATAQQVKEQVGQQAAQAAQQLRERGTSFLSDQKTRASTTLDDLGNAISAAACRLEKDNDDAIAGYVHGAADQVRVLSTYLKDKPVESLFSDFCDMARRKPEYFVGGMFVAGLALARFAKSGSVQAQRGSYGREQYSGAGYGAGYGGPGYASQNYGGVPSYTRQDSGASGQGSAGGDAYSTGPRSALPMPGQDAASGGHEIVNPYAVPFTGTDATTVGTGTTSTTTSSTSPTGAGQAKPLGL
jgi:ElaB/YqjD/DUF883 family membrane-anchored ribosome-binding protein